MSLAGIHSPVLPLATYLEAPEEIVKSDEFLTLTRSVLHYFEDVKELTALLLKITDHDAPYTYQEEIPFFFEINQSVCVAKLARIIRLLRHTFNMTDIDHATIREFLTLWDKKAKSQNDNVVKVRQYFQYQQYLQSYRQYCYQGLQKANVWYALLQHVMPCAEALYPEEILIIKNDMIVHMCTEIFDPCANLMHRIMAEETLEHQSLSDYFVVKEKITWMLQFLPNYMSLFLEELKTPLPELEQVKQGRIKLHKVRLKSLLFFMYQSRIFLTVLGNVADADRMASFFKQFLTQFETVISDPTLFPAEIAESFRKLTRIFSETTTIIEQATIQEASGHVTLNVFTEVGQRLRMTSFHQLEAFYENAWLNRAPTKNRIRGDTIIAAANKHMKELTICQTVCQVEKRFDILMAKMIQVLNLYLYFPAAHHSFEYFAEVHNTVYDMLLSVSLVNDDVCDVKDKIAASLIKGLIKSMIDDLSEEYNALKAETEVEAESHPVDELTESLDSLDLSSDSEQNNSPRLIFSEIFKPDSEKDSDSENARDDQAPTLKERRAKVRYV